MSVGFGARCDSRVRPVVVRSVLRVMGRRRYEGAEGRTLSPKKYWITWISEKIKIVLNAQRFLTGYFMLKWY
jgi:hypothetical protein